MRDSQEDYPSRAALDLVEELVCGIPRIAKSLLSNKSTETMSNKKNLSGFCIRSLSLSHKFANHILSMVAQSTVGCRVPEIDDICVIAKAQNACVRDVLPQKFARPVHPCALVLVKPGVVRIARQPVHEHDIDSRLYALYVTIVQRFNAIVLAFSDGWWRSLYVCSRRCRTDGRLRWLDV